MKQRQNQRIVDALPFDTKLQRNVDPCENHNVRRQRRSHIKNNNTGEGQHQPHRYCLRAFGYRLLKETQRKCRRRDDNNNNIRIMDCHKRACARYDASRLNCLSSAPSFGHANYYSIMPRWKLHIDCRVFFFLRRAIDEYPARQMVMAGHESANEIRSRQAVHSPGPCASMLLNQ